MPFMPQASCPVSPEAPPVSIIRVVASSHVTACSSDRTWLRSLDKTKSGRSISAATRASPTRPSTSGRTPACGCRAWRKGNCVSAPCSRSCAASRMRARPSAVSAARAAALIGRSKPGIAKWRPDGRAIPSKAWRCEGDSTTAWRSPAPAVLPQAAPASQPEQTWPAWGEMIARGAVGGRAPRPFARLSATIRESSPASPG